MTIASRRRRAFVLSDAVIGLTLLGVLMAALATTALQMRRASEQLADRRAAAALAEGALTDMQNGTPARGPEDAGARVAVGAAAHAADGGPASAPAGLAWAEARAVYGRQEVRLIGLVRGDALRAGAAGPVEGASRPARETNP